MYLVFETQKAADKALKQINSNMHFPKPGVNAGTGQEEPTKGLTTNWANAEQRSDGCYCFLKPGDKYMKGVEGATEEKYNPIWFPESSLEDSPQ